MYKLDIKRFIQEPSCCAVAASASISNYYNSDITYEITKTTAEDMLDGEVLDGLYSGEIANLLGLMGFQKIDIISSNMSFLDYSYAKLSKKQLTSELHHLSKSKYHNEYKGNIKSFVSLLSNKEYDGNLIIDYHFGKYIKDSIRKNRPVIVSFNWSMFFRLPKRYCGKSDPDRGDSEEHAVVVCGFDKSHTYIVDSHCDFYKYSLKKYRSGYYKIKWEELMSVVGQGDVIIPYKYNKNRMYNYELV